LILTRVVLFFLAREVEATLGTVTAIMSALVPVVDSLLVICLLMYLLVLGRLEPMLCNAVAV